MENHARFKPDSLLAIVLLTLVLALVLPLLNSVVAPESALYVSNFHLNLWGKYLCYAALALSLNLLWGYMGLLCLGQALFFALGGYAFGMYMMLQIGELGAYKSPLPDFMVFSGLTELPLHWRPFDNFWVGVVAAVLVPAVVALVFGFLAFRARIKGVYFAIITQALTYAACLLFFRNDFTFGGNNGFTDFKFILDYPINAPSTQRTLFVLSALYLGSCAFFTWWLTRTKFGKIQLAIRDSENRVRFSGYSTTEYKLFIFVVSAAMAGIAGALYVPQVGIINPAEMLPAKSLEIVVWVAVGGRATVLGPVLGAVFVNWLKSYATQHYPDYWLIILGVLFILVVLFMPKGIVGIPGQLRQLWQCCMRLCAGREADTSGTSGNHTQRRDAVPAADGSTEGNAASAALAAATSSDAASASAVTAAESASATASALQIDPSAKRESGAGT